MARRTISYSNLVVTNDLQNIALSVDSGTGNSSFKGLVGIGQTFDTESLEVNGNTKTKGLILNDTGSDATPSLRFSASTNTGLYSTGSSTSAVLQLVTNGVSRGLIYTDRIYSSLPIGIGVTPTSSLHIKAGTASAGTAPIKLTSGTLMTNPEAGAIEFLTDAYYGTITTGAVRKEIGFKPTKNILHVCVDSTKGDFTTVKAAVDWFNANATSDTTIIVDAGIHPVAASIVVNNTTYDLMIRGSGSGVCHINATSALNNSPMFNIKSNCDFTHLSVNGSAATGTCIAFVFDTTPLVYSEISDIMITSFAVAVSDTIGIDLFLFNFVVTSCTTGMIQNYSTPSGGNDTLLDIETGNFQSCTTGVALTKGSLCRFMLINLCFLTVTNAITYDGTQYLIGNICNIFGCSWDGTGTFISGFDFKRTDGRDANVVITSNVGIESKVPHAKINVIDNTVGTTITTGSTYYKILGMNSEPYVVFNNAATAGTYTITIGSQTTASIAFNATAATIQTAINNLSNVTSVTVTQIVANKEWTIEFLTTGEGWVDMPVSYNIAGLTGPTSYTVTNSYYTCKWGITNNRLTYQSPHERDGILWISGNLAVSVNNRNATIGVKKNNTGNIICPFTVRTTTSGQPYPFSLVIYLEDVAKNDYFELWTTSTGNGDVVTLSDLTMFIDTR